MWPVSEWMGGRAVEGTGLENRQAFARLVGSNPTPSATFSLRLRAADHASGLTQGKEDPHIMDDRIVIPAGWR